MTTLPLNQILLGNCVEVLKDFPDDCIDLVVTDPPYGLNFMGKDWDKALPPQDAFEEIIRVLKPGALGFVMSSPRQDLLWRMLSMLEGVGFELTQSYIDWIYKTGFPKAYDVSKGIDKKIGRINHSIIDIKKKLRNIYENSNKSFSKINEECGFNASGYLALYSIEKRPNPWTSVLPSYKKWLVIKKVTRYSNNDLDEIFKEAEREVVGDRGLHFYSDKEHPNSQVPHENFNKANELTAPSSDLAKKWEGWKAKTGLKPAHEPILMVNKPFSEKTIVDNVLKWGTGAINIDSCRIPIDDKIDDSRLGGKGSWTTTEPQTIYGNGKGIPRGQVDSSVHGRFPANLLISDRALDNGKTSKSGEFKETHKIKQDESGHGIRSVYGKFAHVSADKQIFYGDEGSPYRYFDLDAWAKHKGFLDVPKPDNSERDFGLKGKKRIPTSKFNLSDGKNPVRLDGAISNPRRNIHPTVKPIKLMAYLIELGCPPNGVVLDPFVGSGTTCIAAKQLVRKFIGIELNPKYHALAEARVKAHPVPLSWFQGNVTEDCRVPPNVCKEEEE